MIAKRPDSSVSTQRLVSTMQTATSGDGIAVRIGYNADEASDTGRILPKECQGREEGQYHRKRDLFASKNRFLSIHVEGSPPPDDRSVGATVTR